jgi:outer membrane biosynthesis protein TonB
VLWFVGSSPGHAPRTPFVLLILGILGCGLVCLLLLNTATASDSFRAGSLQQQNNALTLRQQALQREVSSMEAPQALAKAAAELGMVPGPDPAFLILNKDGSSKVVGNPSPTTPVLVPPPPAPTTPPPSPTPSATPSHSPSHSPSKAKSSDKPSQSPSKKASPHTTPTPTGTQATQSSRHATPPSPTTTSVPTGDQR